MHAFVSAFPTTGVVSRSNSFVSSRSAITRRAPSARRTVARMSLTPAVVDTVNTLHGLNMAEGMAVTFPAYLAVFLGTLIPCAFLVILYIQAESRKAGEESARNK